MPEGDVVSFVQDKSTLRTVYCNREEIEKTTGIIFTYNEYPNVSFLIPRRPQRLQKTVNSRRSPTRMSFTQVWIVFTGVFYCVFFLNGDRYYYTLLASSIEEYKLQSNKPLHCCLAFSLELLLVIDPKLLGFNFS